jgi:hypothetical protein
VREHRMRRHWLHESSMGEVKRFPGLDERSKHTPQNQGEALFYD